MSDHRALFALEEARIESGGSTTEPLRATGGARRVALVGYFSPFLRLLRGDARLVTGTARLAGVDVTTALRSGLVSVASREAPLAAWSTERYLEESARLAGASRHDAAQRVAEALTGYGLVAFARRTLADLTSPVRRVISLASASVTGARLVCAEAPFSDLDPMSAGPVAAAVERLAERAALVLTFPALPRDGHARAALERADFVVLARRGHIAHAGPTLPGAPAIAPRAS